MKQIQSVVYGLLIAQLFGCLQTNIERPTYDSSQLPAATPWQARGKILISMGSERKTLSFIWTHLSEKKDRLKLGDTFGLLSISLVKEFNKYYRENNQGQRVQLSANALEEPLAGLLSNLPSDIARLLTGGSSLNSRVTSEVVSWSTSAQFATPKVLRITFDSYSLRIFITQWEIGISE